MELNFEYKKVEDNPDNNCDNSFSEENLRRVLQADKKHFMIKSILKDVINFDVEDIEEESGNYLVYGTNENNESECYYFMVRESGFTLFSVNKLAEKMEKK